jgi:hypothetical protein
LSGSSWHLLNVYPRDDADSTALCCKSAGITVLSVVKKHLAATTTGGDMRTASAGECSTGLESNDSLKAEAHCESTDVHVSSVSAEEEETREGDNRLATAIHEQPDDEDAKLSRASLLADY